MAKLFASGRIVDAIVLFMMIEYAVLMLLQKRSHRGLLTGALVTNLAAGAALLMSLRAALTGSPWQVVALWLMVSLLAHVIDVRMRWAAKPDFLTR